MPKLWELLAAPGPALCEIMLDTKQEFEPRLKSRQLPDGTIVSPALEDMFPFLDPEELRSNLFIKPQ
jgi:acetolactate synthase-1/2/3 large subunit